MKHRKWGHILTIVSFGSFVVTVVILLLFKAPRAQESLPQVDVSIEQPSRTTVLPFEPFQIVVHLKNKTDHPQSITESWQVFRYVYVETRGWEMYYPENVPLLLPLPPKAVVLQPGEVHTWLTYFDFDAHDEGRHVFARPGSVLLKVSIGRIDTEPLSITVVAPQGEDLRAYEFLEQTKLVRYFSKDFFDRYPYNQETISALETFIRNFSESTYKEYAQLALALMWMHGVEGKRDLTKAKDLLTDLSLRAKEHMTAQSYYYLGLIANEQGEGETAKHYYQRIIQEESDPYLHRLAEQALQKLLPSSSLSNDNLE